MINVPDIIKDLYHLDHCYKNIRIHFPNGERSDICNDLIVKDSVSFKESLCSQNTLKFGLCEASAFECETVGVGNIKGATIEVSCEIECPSDVTGAVWRVDLQKHVYPIPYGTFVVSEAKRQADMIHRRITAYGGTNRLQEVNPLIKYKARGKRTAVAYSPNIFAVSVVNSGTDKRLADALYTQKAWQYPSYPECYLTNYFYKAGESQASNPVAYYWIDFYGDSSNYDVLNENRLYFVEPSEALYTQDEIFTILFDGMKSERPTDVAFLDEMERTVREMYRYRDIMAEKVMIAGTSPDYSLSIGSMSPYFYPYQEDNTTFFTVPHTIRLNFFSRYGIQTDSKTVPLTVRTPGSSKLYEVNISNYPSDSVSFPRTIYNPDLETWAFDETAVNYYDLTKAMAELYGMFFNLSHGNSVQMINIKDQFGLLPGSSLYPGSNLYPQGVTGGKLYPKDYQSCWYDDEYSMPYGKIECTYKAVDPEDPSKTIDQISEVYFNGFDATSDASTYKVYELKDNYIIQNIVWTHAQILLILNRIAQNLAGVSYIPVDFKGRGLPYVEAGDTFEILTKSNDSITTIVLNRTIKGEQTLEDNYSSV